MSAGGSGAVVEDELVKALDRYAKASSYSATFTTTIQLGGQKTQTMRHTMKCKAPNLVLLDFDPFEKIDGVKAQRANFLSDGKRYIEGAEDATLETVPPHAIADIADTFILGQSWSHATYAPRLFAGSHNLVTMWKTPPLDAGKETIGGREVKLYKFTGPAFFGSTEIGLDPQTGDVVLVRAKMEPLLQMLQSKLPGVDEIQFEENFTNQKFNEPIPNGDFKLAFKPKQITAEVTPAGWLRPGEMVPDFTFVDKSGAKIKLSSLRGKTVYLDFWATWCGPCKQTLPDTETLYKKHHSNPKVAIFAISNEKPDVIQSFISANGYTFPVGLDESTECGSRLGVTAFPTFVVIDPQGRLVGRIEGANPPALSALLTKAGL